ncbi:MAG: hypothetical protein KJO21_01945 [Verrucomicrobiae bacterium]|nr:hypothetical protein [Verrucomicrobiae bacterium]NNJ44060.1 hypothetical protein [Akkermansiaceae bacterium]
MNAIGVNQHKGRAATLVLGAVMVSVALVSSFVLGDDVDVAQGNELTDATPVAAAEIMGWVGKLSDDAYLVREQAMKDLWKSGVAALPALRQAAGAGDPELTDRSNELILYISAGVLIESPDAIKKLVLEFSHSPIKEKLVILRKLMDLGQWKQVLHLAKLERRPEVRTQLADIVKTTAARAARNAIAQGDYEQAAEILQMGADDAKLMVMRAWFHACRGRLQQELEKAADIPGKEGALWRMSLHRAAGDVGDAVREAQKAGRNDIADALRVLEGDALPWLQRGVDRSGMDAVYSMGCRIQLARLAGDDKRAAAMARELVTLAVNPETEARAVTCLAANGFRKEAVEIMVKQDVDSAFEYYDMTESPQRCLEILGIPRNAKPPYTAWVKKFTDHAIEEDEEILFNRLVTLAGFLVSRGQGEHALAVLSPMMSALEEDGADEWFDLLTTMLDYNLGAVAIHLVQQRGNEHGDADFCVKKMFEDIPSKLLNHLWTALKKRNPQDVTQALHELALLSGVIADPDSEVDKLHKSLRDEVADEGAKAKELRMIALFKFAAKRNDIATASRMADALAAGNDHWTSSKTYLDAGLLRWEKIEPHYADLVEKNPADYLSLTRLYITMRKLGRDQQAEKMYQRALMASMGGVSELSRIGWELHDAGYQDKAADLWMRAAMMADPGNENYDRVMVYLAHYGQAIYRSKQWKKAAAIAEVNTQLMMRGRGSRPLHSILRTRFYAEFSHGMHLLQRGKKARAMNTLDAARQLIPGDGTLADEFFPSLRAAGIGQYYDRWFDDSYRHIAAACKLYPKSHNTQNTAAWLASRSVRRLDDAEKHAEAALKMRPHQGAYLDTMAEVWFAKGDRAKALEWSQKAIKGSISNAQGSPRSETMVISNFKQLHQQHERFKNDSLPRADR